MHFQNVKFNLQASGALIAIALFAGLSSCKAQSELSVHPDVAKWRPVVHKMSIFEGRHQCLTAEPLILAKPQDILLFIPKGADATVSRLSQPPINYSGKPLSSGPDTLNVPRGGAHAIVIAEDAEGEYELKLSCGRFEDDPPRVIVAR